MCNSERCRAFVVHLRAEHRQLNELLSAAVKLLSRDPASRGVQYRDELGKRLQRIHQELQHHFEEEQSGGCIEEAMRFRPDLSQEATRLEDEHPVILSQLARLIAMVESRHGKLPAAFDNELLQFTRTVRDHEDAENRILAESFGLEADELA